MSETQRDISEYLLPNRNRGYVQARNPETASGLSNSLRFSCFSQPIHSSTSRGRAGAASISATIEPSIEPSTLKGNGGYVFIALQAGVQALELVPTQEA